MPQNQVDSGACGRHVTPADGVGSLKQGPRTHPAHADGGSEYSITVPTGTAKMEIPD